MGGSTLRRPLREPLRRPPTDAAAVRWLRRASALRECRRRPVRGRQFHAGYAPPATAARRRLAGAGRASCRPSLAIRASDGRCTDGPSRRQASAGPRRRALGRQHDLNGTLGRLRAAQRAAPRRASRAPGCSGTWRRPRLHRLPAGRASRRDRTPTGHALVRSVIGTHPQAMACDLASIAEPLAAGHPSALALIVVRLPPPAHPVHAVGRRPGGRATQPLGAVHSALRDQRCPRDRYVIRYGNRCALRCIWRQTPSPREFRRSGGRLLKGPPTPGRLNPPISGGTHGRTLFPDPFLLQSSESWE